MRPDHKPVGWIKRLGQIVLVALVWIGPAVAQEGSPRSVVERLNDALLEVMQASAEEGIGYEERFRRLRPVLESSFDFPMMARLAVGPEWRDLEPAVQERIAELFATMSVANFAARFDDHGGERFEVTGQEPGPRDAILVKSRIVRPRAEPVGLDYLLREQPGGWRIIDVFLDSRFSELARQRAEFGAILRQEGADALIRSLESMIAALEG